MPPSDAAQAQRALYDREYSRLPDQLHSLENWRRSYIQRMFRTLALRPGDRFLDVGVGGTGYTVLAAAQQGVHAVGTDISPVACATAARYRDQLGLGHSAAFLPASATDLPFNAASFDKVISNAVLEHVDDDDAAMDELCRVTAPGGRLLVCVPNTYLTMSWPLALLNLYNDRKVGHLRHYAATDILHRFRRRGFRTLDVTFHGHTVKLLQASLVALLPVARRVDSSIWWQLEQLDLLQRDDASSMNVTVVLERGP